MWCRIVLVAPGSELRAEHLAHCSGSWQKSPSGLLGLQAPSSMGHVGTRHSSQKPQTWDQSLSLRDTKGSRKLPPGSQGHRHSLGSFGHEKGCTQSFLRPILWGDMGASLRGTQGLYLPSLSTTKGTIWSLVRIPTLLCCPPRSLPLPSSTLRNLLQEQLLEASGLPPLAPSSPPPRRAGPGEPEQALPEGGWGHSSV